MLGSDTTHAYILADQNQTVPEWLEARERKVASFDKLCVRVCQSVSRSVCLDLYVMGRSEKERDKMYVWQQHGVS